MRNLFLFFIILFTNAAVFAQQNIAPAPLFRDPVTDGAADPVVFWNRQEKAWWMLYTQRRANTEAADVAYCYGTPIGIASSENKGRKWVYRGTLELQIEKGTNTFWAPEVIYDKGIYHLFLAYIQGVHIHWGGKKRLAHYTSKNAWDWTFEGFLNFPSESVIDASICKLPNGNWGMWYKDESKRSYIMKAESSNLFDWVLDANPAISGRSQEGPKIFWYMDSYWMLTDEWKGMRVYKSKDAATWEKQGLILDSASSRKEDGPSGAHGDVIIVDNKAYIFYFTHPERKSHLESPIESNGIVPFKYRRSSIQVAELILKDGTLICNREQFDFTMPDRD